MESQEDSEDRVSGNDITPPPFTLLFYRHGALGIYLYVFVAHFTEFLLGSQGIPFQQMGKMCLLSLLDGQPASSQGLLGKVVHPSLLGPLSGSQVAIEGSFELTETLLSQPLGCITFPFKALVPEVLSCGWPV